MAAATSPPLLDAYAWPPPLRPVGTGVQHVIVASDDSRYLAYWADACAAWADLADVRATLVWVTRQHTVWPPELQAWRRQIAVWPAMPHVPTATQAQCLRLVAGALAPPDHVVLLSDVDLFPLDAAYYHRPWTVAGIPAQTVVVYRPLLAVHAMVAISFVAATGATWRRLVQRWLNASPRATLSLAQLHEAVRRMHVGQPGWFADQRILYRWLYGPPSPPVWLHLREGDDAAWKWRRWDKTDWEQHDAPPEHETFTDTHLPVWTAQRRHQWQTYRERKHAS